MNAQHVKGEWNDLKGKAKEEIGHAAGDNRTEAEGVADRIKGKVQREVANIKDKAKEKIDKMLE